MSNAEAGAGVRPLRADAERNRRLILDAAERVLARSGVAVPIDEVAREAGVGVGTLYRRFPTKEALLEAVFVGRVERLIEEARARATADDPGAAFFGFLEQCVELATAKRDLAEALARAGIDIEAATTPERAQMAEAIAVLLARAQEAGAVRRDVGMPELFGLVAGTCMVAERQDPEVCSASRMLGIVFDGLRPAAAPRDA